jgi:excisionase family DNA binding protein
MSKETPGETAMDGLSRLMTVTDAAAHLGVSSKTIRRYIEAGKLGSVYDKGRVLVQMQGVNALSDVPKRPAQMASAVTVQPVHAPEPVNAAHAREVELLEARIRDLQDTIETYKRMLPAPTPAGRVQWREIVFWIVVLTILAMAAYMVAVVTAPDPATIHRLAVTRV